MIQKLFILILLIYSTNGLLAQQDTTDTEIEKLYNELKKLYKDSVELIMPFSETLISRKDVQNDSTWLIKIKKYQGLANRKIGNYVQSIEIFKEIYDYSALHKDSFLLAESADQIATMNTFMGNMIDGQKYMIEVAQLYKKIGSKKDIADSNNGLAILYNDLGQTEKAVEMYHLALSQYEEINDTLGRAHIHANLGILYTTEKKYELAEKNLLMQGYLDTLLKTQWGLGFHHDFMGYLKNEQGRHKEALSYYKNALDIRLELPSHYNLAETRAGLSRSYMLLGNYDQAIKEAELILEHKEEHQSLSQQQVADKLLSQIYEKKKEYKKSLEYHKAYKTMSDSIYNRDMLNEITNKDALYQKAKKDEQIARLDAQQIVSETKINSKNKIITLGGITLFIISFLLFSVYRLLKKVSVQKDQLSDSVKEKDLLLREIHHRVKNNLQLVSSLLTLQGRSIDDATAAQAIHDGKSRVHSMALIHQNLYSRDNLIDVSVKQYLETLIQDLFSTYKINEEKILLTKEIDDIRLDIDTLVPLGLIINELISNSLKYAFENNERGHLLVSIKKSNDNFHLIVEDDGKGYDISNINENSFGTTLIHALTDQLDGTIDIRSFSGKTRTEIKF